MKMKRQVCFPLLIMLLASLIFGILPFGQPSIVYAAPDTLYLLPVGSGNYTNIADVEPAGTPHWEAVDDPVATPDDLTTYVSTTSSTQEKDAYTLQDTTQTGTINSVTVYFRCRSTLDGKIHYMQPFLRLSDNETTGTELSHSSNVWTTFSETLARPGGGDWTWTDINNLEVAIGLRDGGAGLPQLTQVYVAVDYTPPDISNTPTNYAFGLLPTSSTANTTLTYFTVSNNSTYAITITIGGTDMIGDNTWELSDTATAGTDTYGLMAGLEGGSYDVIVRKTGPYNTLKSNLAALGTQKWGLQILAPTSLSGGGSVSGNVTLTATQF